MPRALFIIISNRYFNSSCRYDEHIMLLLPGTTGTSDSPSFRIAMNQGHEAIFILKQRLVRFNREYTEY